MAEDAHETYDEYSARIDEHFSRPEVIERMLSLPVTHIYNRTTKTLRAVEGVSWQE